MARNHGRAVWTQSSVRAKGKKVSAEIAGLARRDEEAPDFEVAYQLAKVATANGR